MECADYPCNTSHTRLNTEITERCQPWAQGRPDGAYLMGVLSALGRSGMNLNPPTIAISTAVVLGAVIILLKFCRPKRKELFANGVADAFVDLPLRRRVELSEDSLLLTFGLPAEDCATGLIIGQHIYARIGETQRPYTPVTPVESTGSFDLVVKVYNRCPAFPEGGKLSQLLGAKKVGETVAFKPARCKLRYDGAGAFSVLIPTHRRVHGSHVFMIAGGTGITPMMQVIEHVLRPGHADKTLLTLIYCVRHPSDVLLRSTLEEWVRAHPNQLKVIVTFSGPAGAPSDHGALTFRAGRITSELVTEALTAQKVSAGDAVALICGPHSLNESCKHMLHDLHFHNHAVFTL